MFFIFCFHELYTCVSLASNLFDSMCSWTMLITEGTRRVLESWYKLNARIRGSHVRLDLHVSDHIPLMDVGSVLELYMKNASYSSPCLHFCDSSCRASGWIWFLIPPKTLEVASVAMMSGLTTAGGSWRRTPPTAPVIPRCSCSLVAVS